MEEMVDAEYNDDDIIMHYMSDLKLACVLVLQKRVEDGESVMAILLGFLSSDMLVGWRWRIKRMASDYFLLEEK